MDRDPTPRRKLVVLGTLCLSLLVVQMDNTVVNVALPTLRTELHASISGLQWTVDAYTLVLACFLMLAGATGDRIGRRRTFHIGLVVFGAGSLLCSAAPSVGWLIGARVVQAVGGTMLNPVAMSIITNVFVEPRERARALATWGAVLGVSLGLGPVVGGVLTESVGWRSIFWVNVPIIVVALVLSLRWVPESRAARPRRVDAVGQVQVVVLLASTVAAVIEAPRLGWTSWPVLGLAALAVVALVTLVRGQSRRSDPLIDVRFFRSIPFSGATVAGVCGPAGFGGFLFLSALYLQDVRGLSSFASGLALLPTAVAAVLASPLAGRLLASRGPRPPLVVAGAGMALGALVGTQVGPATPVWVLLAGYAAFGVGFGMFGPPVTSLAVGGMPLEQAGVASAVASTSRQTGQAVGVAVVGTVVASATGTVPGIGAGWGVVAGASAAVAVLGVVATTRRARATARRPDITTAATVSPWSTEERRSA